LPVDAATSARGRGAAVIAAAAPRILNEPVCCSVSSLSARRGGSLLARAEQSVAPTGRSSSSSGVWRTKRPMRARVSCAA
jgi:hypothetical protein